MGSETGLLVGSVNDTYQHIKLAPGLDRFANSLSFVSPGGA